MPHSKQAPFSCANLARQRWRCLLQCVHSEPLDLPHDFCCQLFSAKPVDGTGLGGREGIQVSQGIPGYSWLDACTEDGACFAFTAPKVQLYVYIYIYYIDPMPLGPAERMSFYEFLLCGCKLEAKTHTHTHLSGLSSLNKSWMPHMQTCHKP